MSDEPIVRRPRGPRFLRLHLTNFLSYSDATLEFGDLVALVGPNSSGKSNAVAAIKLLREIPFHGLPTAVARRGGFGQLRHISSDNTLDPALRLDFQYAEESESFYELTLRSVAGTRYSVLENAEINTPSGRYTFLNNDGRLRWSEVEKDGEDERVISSDEMRQEIKIPPGQSVTAIGVTYGAYMVSQVLQSMQTVEINPARVGELQEPSSIREFEPDGSNTASIYENLSAASKRELIDELTAIVPGIERVIVRKLADKVTLSFQPLSPRRNRRGFLAKQMSDGTLRAFGILLSVLQPSKPALLVIEEPEIAIHLGALRTLVDILRQKSELSQIVITTHSADIVDTLDPSSLRVVWNDLGESRISRIADHTIETVRKGLITPGELLRSDALDPAGT